MKRENKILQDLKVNWPAIEHAKLLISQGKINCNDSCGQNKPIIKNEKEFLEYGSIQDYGKWFFMINENIKESNKDHYELPLGDFTFIYRDSIVAAKKHAEQYNSDEGIAAANELIILIDEKCRIS